MDGMRGGDGIEEIGREDGMEIGGWEMNGMILE